MNGSKYLVLCLMIQSTTIMCNLTNHDFCMKVKNNECSGKFSYECKPDKCSIDMTSCLYFNSLVFVLSISKKSDSEKKKFNDFKRYIINCPTVTPKMKPGDFCLNTSKCSSQNFNVVMNMWERTNTTCSCTGKHSYKCSENICSISIASCQHFKMEKKMKECQKKVKL